MTPYYIPRKADLSEVHYLVQKDQTAKPVIYAHLPRQIWIHTQDIPKLERFLIEKDIPFK